MESLYNYPEYYEMAFSYRDIRHEVQIFEECFKRFSRIPVRNVLEIGSGPSPHLEELEQIGLHYTGIDINDNMLEYTRRKAESAGITAEFIKRDMLSFTIAHKVDFAFILLGSLVATSEQELMSHFNSVADALNPGGLYLLDYCIQFQPDLPSEIRSWQTESNGVKIDVRFIPDPAPNRATQVGKSLLTAAVYDNGREFYLESPHVTRVIYPQEFLLLIEKTRKFEFIGWWNHWDLEQPIENADDIDNPITVIRRI